MQGKIQTPLAYVMDLLGVSGTKLAAEIHIHQSMVSRWKNGTVALTLSTRYFEDIVRSLEAIDEKQGLGTLEHFLSSVYGKPMQREDDIHKHLVMWLNGVNFDKLQNQKPVASNGAYYTAEHKVFKGLSGRLDAMKLFLHAVEDMTGAQVWGIENGHLRMFDSSPAGRKMHKEYANMTSHNNTSFHLLLNLNSNEQQIQDLYHYWMPICAAVPVYLYYTYTLPPSFFESLYFVKDRVAFMCTLSRGNESNMYSAIFEDPYTVKQFLQYGNSLEKSYTPLVRKLANTDPLMDFKDPSIVKDIKNETEQFIFLGGLPLLFFEKSMVDEIARELKLKPQETSFLNRLQKQSYVLFNRFWENNKKNRLVFNYEMIQKMRENKLIDSPFLTRYFGRPIQVPSRFYARNLRGLLDLVEKQENCEVALPAEDTQPFFPDMTLWIKENSFVYFYSAKREGSRFVTTEFSSVRSFYTNAQQYWLNLPQVSKDSAYIRRQLELVEAQWEDPAKP